MSLDAWNTWDQGGRKRSQLKPLMAAYQPLVDREVDRWSGSQLPRVALESQAKRLTMKAFRTFDPARSQLQTHVMGGLRGMDEFVKAHSLGVRMSVGKTRLADKAYRVSKQLELELGREATPEEIAMRSGLGITTLGGLARAQNQLASSAEAGGFSQPIREDLSHDQIVAEFLHSDLPPIQQQVLDYSMGLHGKDKLSPGAIAKKLNLSSARISQIKTEIASKGNRYQRATDFLMSS